jgi:hypothetical protein
VESSQQGVVHTEGCLVPVQAPDVFQFAAAVIDVSVCRQGADAERQALSVGIKMFFLADLCCDVCDGEVIKPDISWGFVGSYRIRKDV